MYLHKKTLTVFMVMLLTLFTGCGGGSGNSAIETMETTSTSKAVELVSYGFKVVDQEDVTLTFDTVTEVTADTIPLWYYDYAQGTWVEEGYAIRQIDGTYKGTVSHPGTWSLSEPIEDDYNNYTDYNIYTDRIIDSSGTAVKNLRVDAIGDNWIRTDLATDDNGVFEIEVIPGEEFTLQVYHYVENYSAKYSGKILVDATGNIAYKIN